jgi:hypothetical protein
VNLLGFLHISNLVEELKKVIENQNEAFQSNTQQLKARFDDFEKNEK